MSEDMAQVLGADPQRLAGRTIVAVEAQLPIIGGREHDRMREVALVLDDGSRAAFSYWASHEGDGSLTLEIERVDEG